MSAKTRRRPPTAFERRVYAVVRRIRRGQVRSYRWVAEQLGNPKAARAVGQALTRNPDPERTPCHRVVNADGSLGGYAWGPQRKRRRLSQERAQGWSTRLRRYSRARPSAAVAGRVSRWCAVSGILEPIRPHVVRTTHGRHRFL